MFDPKMGNELGLHRIREGKAPRGIISKAIENATTTVLEKKRKGILLFGHKMEGKRACRGVFNIFRSFWGFRIEFSSSNIMHFIDTFFAIFCNSFGRTLLVTL